MVSRRHLLKLSALGTATFAAPLAYSASNTTMTHKTGNPLGSPSLRNDYEAPIPYASGIEFVRTSQTVSYLNNEYRAKDTFLPFTTSYWEADESKLSLIGDDSLRLDIADISDPLKGAGMVGWSRGALTQSIANVHQMLDAQPVSPWEFAHLVSSRPVATDPSTWDWTPAFAGMHAAVTAGLVKVITLTGIYKLIGGLSSKDYEWSDVTILSAGGVIVLESPVGDNVGLQIGSNVTIRGHLRVCIAKGSGNGNGFARTPICIGRWWDLKEVSNVKIDSLELGGVIDGTAMAIAGNTHGIRVDRLLMSGGKLGLMMHWSGFPENIAPTETYHPHDIYMGSIVGSEFSDSMITASGCYDIRIDYISGKNNYRDFFHLGGDFGEKFAIDRDIGRVCKGTSIGRVNSVGTKFCSVDFNASAGKVSNVMFGEFVIDSIKAIGVGAVSSLGVRIENRDCGGIRYADISNFANNIMIIKCTGGLDGELRSSGANEGGIIYSATKHVRVEQLRTTNDNKSGGGGIAGVNINAQCSDINVGALRVATNNTATHGCVLEPGASDIRIQQANGAVDDKRYLIVDGAAANLNRVGPCILDNGSVSYSGHDPSSSSTARGQSMSWGGGEPQTGVFKRGDISMAASASPGGEVGRICTTAGAAGSTAVFKAWGVIQQVK